MNSASNAKTKTYEMGKVLRRLAVVTTNGARERECLALTIEKVFGMVYE